MDVDQFLLFLLVDRTVPTPQSDDFIGARVVRPCNEDTWASERATLDEVGDCRNFAIQ